MSFLRKSRITYLAVFFILVTTTSLFFYQNHTPLQAASSTTQHYLYVVPDGSLYVYDMDNGFNQVKKVSLPVTGGRGIAVDPASASLFVSYYDSGGATKPGWLLKYNLLNDTVVWNKHLSFTVDSPALTPDGKKIYVPESQASSSGIWHILSTADASSLGTISVGSGKATHNTVVSLNGSHAYLGSLNYNYLVQVDTSTNQITHKMGPLKAGVRPFTINGKETLAFTNATGFLGFEVSDIATGKLLYTVPVNRFTSSAPVPSHGISLSPDEKEVYIIDDGNSYAHVFDVSGLPGTAPKQVADIPLRLMAGNEGSCSFDCQKEGWILHSLDGRYVFAGDSGDVIDTSTRKSIANLPALYDSRKYIEVDFSGSTPVATTTRHGLGRVTSTSSTPTATATATTAVTPTPTATAGSTLAQDTFQRPNQSLWGTASDGQTWSGDANTASVFAISNNAGQISNGSASYSALLGTSATDAEVLFSGSMSSYSNANLGAVLRWKDTNNWYKVYLSGTTVVVQKKVSGATTILGSASFTATANTAYTVRFRVVGTTLYARVWQTGTTEPASWQVTVTDSSLSSGSCGLRMQVASGITTKYTSFLATVPGGTPTPTPGSTPSPGVTPSATVAMTPTLTATAGSTLAQDTFQRPNQSLWGTASDGQTWGGDANTASVFAISNNAGQISNGSASYNAIIGPTATNAEVLFSGSLSSYSNANLGAVLRWKDTNNWYKVYLSGTTVVVQKKVSGATTILGSASFTATANTAYTVRFRVVGTTLYARVWQTGTTEPASWQVTVTDSSLSSGSCGLRMQVASGITAKYASFLATTQ